MKEYAFLICAYTYTFLFLISYIVPCYKDVVFMVNFTNEKETAVNIINKFRTFFLNLSVAFLIITSIAVYLTGSMIYYTFFTTVYIMILLTKYYLAHKETLKLRFIDSKSTTKASYLLTLTNMHFLCDIFIVLLTFFNVYETEKNYSVLFDKSFYVIPITSLFLTGFFVIINKIIRTAPDFAVKEVKLHIINFVHLVSFSCSFFILMYAQLIFQNINIIYFVYAGIYLLTLIAVSIVYLRFILKINRPFEFKVSNSRITEGAPLEISLDGTRIFINFTNKKSRLIIAGLLVYLMAYISFVYFLTM